MEEFSEIIEKILNKKESVDLEPIHEKIITLKEKADINEYDLILHHEDEREVKRLDNIIDGLLTIYEHLSFLEELKKIDSIFMPSELVDDTAVERKLPDIIMEFHRQQVLKKWNRVSKLWEERRTA